LENNSSRITVLFMYKSSLESSLHPMVVQLASEIVGLWNSLLNISSYERPLDFDYIEGKLEGEKMVIENIFYQTPQFRKMHLELAKVGSGLDILHCVMFPRVEYSLPIFGCDIVVGRGSIGAAIVDLSPVSADKTLPKSYIEALSTLPKDNFTQPRELPEWGDIFSSYCLFVRPNGAEEENLFLQKVKNFLEIHCKQSLLVSKDDPLLVAENLAGQQNYCQHQQENDKTRRILEKAFGEEWAARYMDTVLFDSPA